METYIEIEYVYQNRKILENSETLYDQERTSTSTTNSAEYLDQRQKKVDCDVMLVVLAISLYKTINVMVQKSMFLRFQRCTICLVSVTSELVVDSSDVMRINSWKKFYRYQIF